MNFYHGISVLFMPNWIFGPVACSPKLICWNRNRFEVKSVEKSQEGFEAKTMKFTVSGT